jgi:hypothetical protein
MTARLNAVLRGGVIGAIALNAGVVALNLGLVAPPAATPADASPDPLAAEGSLICSNNRVEMLVQYDLSRGDGSAVYFRPIGPYLAGKASATQMAGLNVALIVDDENPRLRVAVAAQKPGYPARVGVDPTGELMQCLPDGRRQ